MVLVEAARRGIRGTDRALARALRLLVAAYRRLISPLLPPACRFYPTCSCYADEALDRHGFVRGTSYAVKRIARCHPFNEGGLDPVPHAEGMEGS